MNGYKLEKSITLFKNQFEEALVDMYQEHRMERLSIDLDGILFRIKYMMKHGKDLDKIPQLKEEFISHAIHLRNTFGMFLYRFLDEIIGYGDEFNIDHIVDVLAQDVKIDATNVTFKIIVISDNKSYLEFIDGKIDEDSTFNMFPDKFFRFYTDSYNDGIAKAYPELFEQRRQSSVGSGRDEDIFCHNFTFQTSEDCSLNCFTRNTRIVMADYTWKYIQDIEVGDMILGFDEHIPGKYKQRSMYPSKVTRTFTHFDDDIYMISGEGVENTYITGRHPLITSRNKWESVDRIVRSDGLMKTDFDINDACDIDISHIKATYQRLDTYTISQLPKSNPVQVYNIETESHTYVAENLLVHNCTYCYQLNKSNMRMTFETAKEFIDHLLDDDYGYINQYNSPAIIIEFIGGEPLMEISLTRRIYEYFLEKTYELDHPWFKLHRVSICSNGLQYFDDAVQDFFKEYVSNISFNISIDGNKELHDSCRIQPNGEGSYDIDILALEHYNKHYTPERNSKMTLAPENMKHLFESVVHFINTGTKCINLNCIFEEGWNQKTALLEYNELKKLADYILNNNLESLYVSIFNERQEETQDPNNDGNFCFHPDTAVATPDGSIKMKDLELGNLIYTASGSIHKVTEMYVGKDELLNLGVDGLPIIKCTKDHKFYSLRNEIADFHEARELNKGDHIWYPILKFPSTSENSCSTDMAYAMGVYSSLGGYHIGDYESAPVSFFVTAFESAGLSFDVKPVMNYEEERRYQIVFGDNLQNQEFFRYIKPDGHFNHIPPCVFKFDINNVRSFIEGYLCAISTDSECNGYRCLSGRNPEITNTLILLARSSGIFLQQHEFQDNVLIYDPRYNVDDLSKLPDGYWCQISYKSDPTGNWTVCCPTVMPLAQDEKEEHTIIAGGLAARQCGGSGSMLSLRPNGEFYPCIRYMPTSMHDDRIDLCMGTVKDGMVGRDDDSEVLKLLDSVTRRAQSNDVCFECPIGSSCSWCSALSHTVYGTPNKRPMFICIQMIAEALANVYYWNLLNIKHPEYNLGIRQNNVPAEWARLVVDQSELDFLYQIEGRSGMATLEQKLKDRFG